MGNQKLITGSFGQYRSFVNEQLAQSFMVQYIGEDSDGDFRFKINDNGFGLRVGF